MNESGMKMTMWGLVSLSMISGNSLLRNCSMASVPFLVVWSLPRLYSMDEFCQEKISNYVKYQEVPYHFIEKYQLTSKMVNFWSEFHMSKKLSEKQLFPFKN